MNKRSPYHDFNAPHAKLSEYAKGVIAKRVARIHNIAAVSHGIHVPSLYRHSDESLVLTALALLVKADEDYLRSCFERGEMTGLA